FQAEDGIRDRNVTGVQTCALPILSDQVYFSDTTIYDYVSANNHSEDKVHDILNKLNLSSSIDNLEQGIHTPIVNHDIPLSGGEKIGRASCRESVSIETDARKA